MPIISREKNTVYANGLLDCFGYRIMSNSYFRQFAQEKNIKTTESPFIICSCDFGREVTNEMIKNNANADICYKIGKYKDMYTDRMDSWYANNKIYDEFKKKHHNDNWPASCELNELSELLSSVLNKKIKAEAVRAFINHSNGYPYYQIFYMEVSE